jgi:hypothetical protein
MFGARLYAAGAGGLETIVRRWRHRARLAAGRHQRRS